MQYVLIVIVILLIALLAFGYKMAGFSMGIKKQTLEEAKKWQGEHYDISWYDGLAKEDYTVKSYDGYVLHVQLLKNKENSGKYVIISHGYTDNRLGALKYARFYLEQGFNAVIYDLRGHGLNEDTFCTYSVKESRDLLALIKDTRERYADLEVLGLHGESLGAATTASCLQYKPEVDFAVADCGFSEIQPVLEGGLRSMHLPGFLVHFASLGAKLRFGYSYGQMRPVEALKDNEVPMMFIHGQDDNFILPAHSEKMQKTTKGYSELHLIKGAGHAYSAIAGADEYRVLLANFLAKVLN